MSPFSTWSTRRQALRPLVASLLTAMIVLLFALSAKAAVTLLYVRAEALANGAILIRWETASELNTSAFRLYRAVAPDGPWTFLLEDSQQPAKGDIVGATYSYTDADVTRGVTYYYLLEEIENNDNLVRYEDYITSATAGVLATATATSTPTSTNTATRTATVTGSPTVTGAATATATRTPTDTPTPEPPGPPTATRRYTNTPKPTPTAETTLAPTEVTPATGPSATPLPPAQVISPTPGLASPPADTGAPTPPAPSPASEPDRTTPTATQTEQTPPDQLEAPVAPPGASSPTSAPAVFEPKATGEPAAKGILARPTATSVPPQAAGDARNTRLILLLGGGAIGLALLLSAIALVIWRLRQR